MANLQVTKLDSNTIKKLKQLGWSIDLVRKHLRLLKQEQPIKSTLRPAILGDGIIKLNQNEQADALDFFNRNISTKRYVRFVPASGLATRMFREPEEIYRMAKSPSELKIVLNKPNNAHLLLLYQQAAVLPFFNQRKAQLELNSKEDRLIFNNFLQDIFDTKRGLANKPKSLVPFFETSIGEKITPFEAHIYEALTCAYLHEEQVSIHFTLDERFLNDFIEVEKKIMKRLLPEIANRLVITYSFQDRLTDTPVLANEGNWLLDKNKNPLFRKGGHGALLNNLDAIEADIIFIKNIDNITYGEQHLESLRWHNILCGLLLKKREEIFAQIGKTINPSNQTVNELVHYIKDNFNKKFELKSNQLKTAINELKTYLNRPFRICAVVKNKGHKGGGPYWMQKQGEENLQIVESVEISKEQQSELAEQISYFNPTLIFCSVTDSKSNKYHLEKFVDDSRYMISEKTVKGKSTKILEWPGLWNGSMAHWNTIFVEVPQVVFKPVKSVMDFILD